MPRKYGHSSLLDPGTASDSRKNDKSMQGETMTPVEKNCLDLLLRIRQFLTGGTPGKWNYMVMLGEIRDQITVLEHLPFCPTGTHESPCTCKPPIVGYTAEYYKAKRRG
jgi:hypothetical protein